MLRHSAATVVATGKIGSKQRKRPIQKHARRRPIDRKMATHLSNPQYLLTCDTLSCERLVNTVLSAKEKELRPLGDFSPSMLLYITNFSCCHQWRTQDLSEGQAQSQESSVNTTSDACDREALAFLGGSGGMLPRKILKIEMLRYAFSALLGVFLSLNKGSKLLS